MAGRQYVVEEVAYPSVTTVLGILDKSGALMPWAAKLERAYCRSEDFDPESSYAYKTKQTEALDIGSAVHDAIECYLKHGKDKTKEEIYSKPNMTDEQKEAIDNAFLAFLSWYDETVEECISAECTVVSKEHGFAGTADFIGKFKDGRTMLIDWKTSKGFYSGYGKQVSAYKEAYEETTGSEPLDGCGVLRIDKETGLPEWKDYSKQAHRKWEAFKALLDFYYLDKKRRLKNQKRVIS